MFNHQTNKLNDFTPSWLKLPPTRERRPQSLHWLHNNNTNTFQSRKADSVLQKDDFPCLVEVPSRQNRNGGASAWSAPLTSSSSSPSPSPTLPNSASATASSVIGQLGSRGGNRMYKAMLPRNLTRRVLAPRPTNVQTQQQQPQLQPLQRQSTAEFDVKSVNNNHKDSDDQHHDSSLLHSKTDFMSSAASEIRDAPTRATIPTRLSPPIIDRTETTLPAAISSSIINIHQSNQQRNHYQGNEIYNQNLFPPASPCCDEAEERLLRAMGWKREELAGEGPLTPEEITEAIQWGHQIGINHLGATPFQNRQQKQPHQQEHHHHSKDDLLHYNRSKSKSLQQLKQPLNYPSTDRTNGNFNIIHKHERDLATLTGRSAQLEQAARMGSDLKRALLATMGVLADSDSDLEDDNEDSDDDADDG
ncbi:uncharacterized protein LOC111265265 [Varroa jacobsoni]|uniref:Uncharacterized protein n=1 Tax=Varroa destructor TaxID=109461 RepID=A0A7M7JMB1_VARDE|nr:uncharacterized protein LOC111244974 [Varroa destructor]XP_022648370.1 uncharacterized protein LOC111244974 [Varroa destructor]XP_022697524.1 uncharacterized protein LOC111265265 [Varroa jacobsoni]XP_022697525.1 uncharacterized protein LOC111265265 [Varroa jacobsoni]